MDSLNESTESEGCYQVERILGKRRIRGVTKYLVKWVGYPDSDNTWETEENCVGALDLIREFEAERQRNREQNRSRTSSRGRRSSKQSRSRNRTSTSTRNTPSITSHDVIDNARQQLQNLSFNSSDDVPAARDDASTNVNSVRDPPLEYADDSVISNVENGLEKRAVGCRNISRTEKLRSISPPHEIIDENVEIRSTTSRSIDDIRTYPSTQLEIVGAQPTAEGITIGVRVINEEKIYRGSSKQVGDLWPDLLRCFYEEHLIFDEK